jgi:hypothetical protein
MSTGSLKIISIRGSFLSTNNLFKKIVWLAKTSFKIPAGLVKYRKIELKLPAFITYTQ